METGLSATQWASLVQAIAAGGRLRRAWPLAGGISASMTAFEVETPNGELRRMVLRRPSAQTRQRNPQAAGDEFKLLRLARGAGLAVPRAEFVDQEGGLGLGPCLVIEFIEGHMEFAPADPADFIAQLARQLALIHAVDASGPQWSFLPPARLAGEVAAGPAPEGALDTRPMRAALAAAAWPPPPHASTLLHGDFWPGNVLWRPGQLAAVIDWEDAARGDPLADLAIARLDVLCLFGREAMQRFTRQYQAGRAVDDEHLPYWDACAALRLARLVGADLAGWAAFFGPYGRADLTAETLRERYTYFAQQALAA